jgi:signal transduction histidine kinase
MASRGRENASPETGGAPTEDGAGGLAIGLRALGALLILLAAAAWAGFAQLAVAAVAPVAGVLLVVLPSLRRRQLTRVREERTAQIEALRERVRSETRMSTALLDVATTLSSTLETSELLARLNLTSRNELDAEWSATFLVDAKAATFRLVAASEGTGKPVEFPLGSWSPVTRLEREHVIVLTGADAERACALFGRGRSVASVLVTALRGEGALAGFLAVGCGTLDTLARERAVRFLAGMARHATVVLRSAQLVEQVRLASDLKSEFVGAISHELRSPLNVVLGYVEMMMDGALGPVSGEQVHALQRTQEQSLALLEMITALLDLNRLERGRLPLQRTTVAVESLLAEICDQLPATWRRPEVPLLRAIVPGMGTIETDPGKLKTVVRNLLHNAFKFTEQGHVTLGAGIDETGAIVITVSDTGRGIPREALDYVFELFRQVPGAGGGGVGLGLHLVRRLVQALGGTISVESTVGTGTCFRITVPRVLPAADDQGERKARPSPAADLATARNARQARSTNRVAAARA